MQTNLVICFTFQTGHIGFIKTKTFKKNLSKCIPAKLWDGVLDQGVNNYYDSIKRVLAWL